MSAIRVPVVLVVFMCLMDGALAANAPNGGGAVTLSNAEVAKQVEDVKISALKEEVQALKDFTRDLLATVYFSLGTVVIIVISMLGFSWYVNFRVYERDKESMRQALNAFISEDISLKTSTLDRQLTERVLSVDAKFAGVLERVFKRVEDLRVTSAASEFRVVHFGKTPRTDLVRLCAVVGTGVGRASPEALREAVMVIVDQVEGLSDVDSTTRTMLLDLARDLPEECGGVVARLKEVLAKAG